ncbi:hypothetical protein [Streptococcus cuniculipharyngis]|uniref:Uncharacterized protein n=1 Tax=Streptococcus cuniculipharyngis TaxID=1562651 RepID=A0A5C5SGE3_9STRE|nr:hypothetical protein [Streptococcus cuniculipharyngis]TWS99188.1 hypothetical protein FRX57_03045 [Streptococcus cuniculipharyngis]
MRKNQVNGGVYYETNDYSETQYYQSGAYASYTVNGTLVEVLNENTLKLTYPDGTSDLLEKRSDGVYKNGVYFLPLQNLDALANNRSANSWILLGTSSGRSDRNSTVNNAIATLCATILGSVGGGAVGAFITAVGLATHSTPPGAYSITYTYFNSAKRQFKVVNQYYKNANFTGYVTTKTSYVNTP